MEEIITGYQYGPTNGEFRCVYEFPNNLDKEEIHMPPFTTLVAPPEEIPAGQLACWNGTSWELKNDTISIKIDPIPDEDIGKLLPEFVAGQIKFGLWSDELQQKYDIARPLYLQQETDKRFQTQKANTANNINI
jgi:hypothetical protein